MGAHVCITAFSADTFAGRLKPNVQEAVVVNFWAATQCFQGLAAEHHAASHHHHGHGLSVHGLLNHLGEFGLCEFGLITMLAWGTYVSEVLHEVLPLKNKRGLKEPLIGKKH